MGSHLKVESRKNYIMKADIVKWNEMAAPVSQDQEKKVIIDKKSRNRIYIHLNLAKICLEGFLTNMRQIISLKTNE